MGTIQKGILGGFRGKVGNVVGFFWKGQAVMRSLAASVSNPKTYGQRVARSRFALAGSFSRMFTNVVDKTVSLPSSYSSTERRNSRINVMMKRVLDSLTANSQDPTTPLGWDVNYSNVIISEAEGTTFKINPTNIVASYNTTTKQIDLTWTDNSTPDQSQGSTDIVMFVVIPSERNAEGLFVYSRGIINDGDFERRDAAGTLDLPEWASAGTVEVYCITRSSDGADRSQSVFVTELTIA